MVQTNPVKLRIVELASGIKRVSVSMPKAQDKTVHNERAEAHKGLNKLPEMNSKHLNKIC